MKQLANIEKKKMMKLNKPRGGELISKQNVFLKIKLQKQLLYGSYHKQIYESNVINI